MKTGPAEHPITGFAFQILASVVWADFRAGAVSVDVTPTTFPVIVNGGMTSRTTDKITTRLKARALALADGETRLVITVVDSFSGEPGISADYFGRFCEGLKQKIAPDSSFVGIMSHGCSGDIWRRDYTQPDSWDKLATIDQYTHGLLDIALKAYNDISYRDDVELAMAERRMTLKYRVPNKQRLEWARRIAEQMGDRLPKTREEVYPAEQIILHERQETEVVVQALRIGDIGIATTPTETYAITGLKIKAASPLRKTVVIELANGGDGYIPPPEQHLLGGYNTWAARSAGLEVTAEPSITETCIDLLEQLTGLARRDISLSRGPAAEASSTYSVSLWLWNGMPVGGRDVTGWVGSRGRDNGLGSCSEHLGIGGASRNTGRLIFQYGSDAAAIVAGSTRISRCTVKKATYRPALCRRRARMRRHDTLPTSFPRVDRTL